MQYTRVFTDEHGKTRFEKADVSLNVPQSLMSMSDWRPASALFFVQAEAGRAREMAPEARRQIAICLGGSYGVTVSDETRVFRSGDVLLFEDLDGTGHASTTDEGFTMVVVPLDSKEGLADE